MTLDRTTVLAGIPDELRAFEEIVRPLDTEALATPTRCAGWTIRDVAAHVVGTVVDVSQLQLEGQGTPAVTHRQAQERAGRSGTELADELASAGPALAALLASLPEDGWEGPTLSDPSYTLGFSVEAMWFDAYLHGDDIRAALALPSARGAGLRCAVHHVAGYLEHRGWGPATLSLSGVEQVDVGGGGAEISGDPLEFVLAATGRSDPTALGLDPTINVYADEADAPTR